MSNPGALRPVSAIVLLVAAIGCGVSTTSTSPTPSPPTTPVPSTPSVTSLAVSGTTPQIGATVQFSATATLSNGSSQTVTSQATWSSSNLSVATVNNAGVVSHHTLDDLDSDEWDRIVDTNLRAVYEVCRAALPHMPAGGAIVNVSSAVAMIGMAARTHYTAAKAGLLGFTRSLCKEVGPRGIRVNAVAPGIIETDQTGGLSEPVRARYEQLAALGRLGTPADVADVVLFLSGPQARFVCGQTLVVDGGM